MNFMTSTKKFRDLKTFRIIKSLSKMRRLIWLKKYNLNKAKLRMKLKSNLYNSEKLLIKKRLK